MKAPYRIAAVALWLGAASFAAQASGWVALLKNTPAEVFDEEDLHLFLDAAGKALAADGGQVVDWTNPGTGAGGSFKPLGQAPSVKGLPCKRLRTVVYARKRAQKSITVTACRTPEDKWKLAGMG